LFSQAFPSRLADHPECVVLALLQHNSGLFVWQLQKTAPGIHYRIVDRPLIRRMPAWRRCCQSAHERGEKTRKTLALWRCFKLKIPILIKGF
jgi:hypothetical protein